MHHQKTLVILATLALLSALLFAISCAAPTAAPPVKETVVVKETVIVQPTAAPKPTEAPKPTLAQLLGLRTRSARKAQPTSN